MAFEEIFAKKKVVFEKLERRGFAKTESGYALATDLLGGDFRLTILVDRSGVVDTKLVEKATGEEYVLYKTGASGSFVGAVRAEVERALADVAETCCEAAAFKSDQTARLIRRVREKHGEELEFLWERFPDYAVWRRKDNGKWYGVLMPVPESKIGGKTEKIVEIVDMKGRPEEVAALVGDGGYRAGWHMNRKYWYAAVLDETIPDAELFERLEESRDLAG